MSQIDLTNLKTQIKAILDDANTTTGSPIDLSQNLKDEKRVQKVLKVNVERIPTQPSFFPAITCFVDGKSVLPETIARNQATGKRKSLVDVKVVAMLWEDNFETATEDPSDEDINVLMENIEEVLRSNSTLNGIVTWSFPTSVDYFTLKEERTHYRVGVMNLQTTIFY